MVASVIMGIISPILNKIVPDANARLEAEQLLLKGLLSSDLSQAEVNKVEAASSNMFVAGWRPFIGWVCGGSFAYSVIGYTFLNWALQMYALYSGHPIPSLPLPDTTLTMELLMAMLGLGGLRTFEKLKGITK